jgi:hypothetical protein
VVVWGEGTRCGQSARAVSELLYFDTRLARKETHLVQPLEHDLEHARPFGAVAGQLCARRRANGGTNMSIEPSRAASCSICSLDNILPTMRRPAQLRVELLSVWESCGGSS